MLPVMLNRTMKETIITSFIILIGLTCQAQELMNPKKIKFKGGFVHTFSKTIFPQTLETDFELTEVYAFDKGMQNIGVTYEKKTEPKCKLNIYVYPAGDGTEDRLRTEYLNSIQSVANLTDNGLGATQYPVKFNGKKYDCNGFKAEFKSNNKENSNLSVYECGNWFLKLRLTTNEKDSIQISRLEKKALETIDPSRLTEQNKLNPKADIYFAKIAFQDSILLGSAMGSAYKKLEWIMDNIPEKERASGFPGHYLEMQLASFNEFVAFEKKYNYKKSEFTQNYLNQINSLIDSGYLDEFIMEEFSMVMIVPENHEFDFDGYEKWKEKNEIEINLNKLFYVISFGQK
jgi:hypothetical protein